MKLPRFWSSDRGAPRLWSRNEGFLPEAFWSTHSNFEGMLRAFERLPSLGGATIVPRVSVAESQKAFEIAVELPGVDQSEIKVTIERDQLVISGEKKEGVAHDEREWHVDERRYGSFYRRIPLPFELVEHGLEALLEKGVLNITVTKPVDVREHNPRSVEIKSRDARSSEPGESGQAGQTEVKPPE